MIKVLIADDEEIIRTSVAQMIPWQELGMDLVGCARNGLEALDMVSDNAPDIIITDIRMPLMDGLDLISRIRVIAPDTEVIILSGFGEFTYAQKAMSLGVKHYLLKPTRKEDLAELLRKISIERAGSISSTYQLERLMYLDGFSDIRSLGQSLRLLGLDPEMGAALAEDGKAALLLPVSADGKVFSFVADPSGDAMRLEDLLVSFIASHSLSSLSIKVSDGDFRRIWDKNEKEDLCFEYAKALREGKTSAELISRISDLLSSMTPLDAGLTLVRMVSSSSPDEGYLPALLATGVLEAGTTDDVVRIADEILSRKQGRDNSRSPVSIIKAYVEKHIDDDGISLKWLSDNVVYLDAGYLSKLFIKDTGMRFSEYLSRTRIAHAKSLMILYNSSTVQEIAEKSGFGGNPRYFSQVFRKYEGMTPSEFLAQSRK